jgi:hypothetical protein
MARVTKAGAILQQVVAFYLNSHDFNGISLGKLVADVPDAIETVRNLIRKGILDVVAGEYDNPHIKRLPPPSIENQIEILKEPEKLICVYPTAKHMRRVIPRRLYGSRPFSRMLALGHPQLEPVFFELAVLRRYQLDPRYLFDFSDLSGSVSITEEYYRSREMTDSDKVLVEYFGLASNAKGHRLIVVYLRYLNGLSARHQGHWNSHRVRGKCKIERNYGLRSIFGEFTDGISVYSALLEEIRHINCLCALIGLPSMFRIDFSEEPPKGFGLLMNTTRQDYLNFAHTLDKIISENLNHDFFARQGIRPVDPTTNQTKGTLTLLYEWLKRFVRIEDEDGAETIMAPLKRVRKERQPNAHTIVRDNYSRNYQNQKEALAKDVYISISNVRMFFQTHPDAKNYEVPTALDPKNIVLY